MDHDIVFAFIFRIQHDIVKRKNRDRHERMFLRRQKGGQVKFRNALLSENNKDARTDQINGRPKKGIVLFFGKFRLSLRVDMLIGQKYMRSPRKRKGFYNLSDKPAPFVAAVIRKQIIFQARIGPNDLAGNMFGL